MDGEEVALGGRGSKELTHCSRASAVAVDSSSSLLIMVRRTVVVFGGRGWLYVGDEGGGARRRQWVKSSSSDKKKSRGKGQARRSASCVSVACLVLVCWKGLE